MAQCTGGLFLNCRETTEGSALIKILFVCGRNQWRSPTAERIYKNDQRVEARSAGVGSTSRRKVNSGDVEWADLILVMERRHAGRIRQTFGGFELPPIDSLEIPDEYQYMDEALIELIKTATEPFLAKGGKG